MADDIDLTEAIEAAARTECEHLRARVWDYGEPDPPEWVLAEREHFRAVARRILTTALPIILEEVHRARARDTIIS